MSYFKWKCGRIWSFPSDSASLNRICEPAAWQSPLPVVTRPWAPLYIHLFSLPRMLRIVSFWCLEACQDATLRSQSDLGRSLPFRQVHQPTWHNFTLMGPCIGTVCSGFVLNAFARVSDRIRVFLWILIEGICRMCKAGGDPCIFLVLWYYCKALFVWVLYGHVTLAILGIRFWFWIMTVLSYGSINISGRFLHWCAINSVR